MRLSPMNRSLKTLVFLFICLISLNNCNSDDDNAITQERFLCCGENPFSTTNVDNLDQSAGTISAIEVFTPNGDGVNDSFGVENIELYANNTVQIFDLNNNLVFETQDYSSSNNVFSGINEFTNEELPAGSYRYRVVVENEQTYLLQGYVCIIRTEEDADGTSFINCIDGFDPILA